MHLVYHKRLANHKNMCHAVFKDIAEFKKWVVHKKMHIFYGANLPNILLYTLCSAMPLLKQIVCLLFSADLTDKVH
jgi:hypothetical protein